MALPVDVQSIEVLRTIRAQLCTFGEDVRNALAATQMEIGRMVNWLTSDRRMYWEAQIRRHREEYAQARADLSRKRTSQMFGSEANLGEQKDNLRAAKLRLEEAEAKLDKVKRWVQPLQQAVMEYRGRAQPMGGMVDSDLEEALALLDRMIVALEEYSSSAPTSTEYVRAMKEERLKGRAEEPSADPTATDEESPREVTGIEEVPPASSETPDRPNPDQEPS
jgi:DNA repair exonuclease SbcCD ATPase subunit